MAADSHHMKQHGGIIQPSTASSDVDCAQQTARAGAGCATGYHVVGQHSGQTTDGEATLAATRFPLLRRLSLTSLVAMLVTATAMILLYRLDQLDEHESIAAQENEKTAIYIMHLLDDQLDAFVTATQGLNTGTLQANPDAKGLAAALDTIHEHHVIG